MITVCQLREIALYASERRLSYFVEPLNAAMKEYEITTPLRQAAFLAQVCHESGSFFVLREMASGDKYEWRADLGNVHLGDGSKYRGRGLLQLTGRKLYMLCGQALELDLISNPDLLEDHPHSSRSAAWYWSDYKELNGLAEKRNMARIADRLGNSYAGVVDLILFYERAKRVFGLKP